MSKQKEHILLDVDGVLLDYDRAFEVYYGLDKSIVETTYLYSERYGIDESMIIKMVDEFNQSDAFSQIKPLPNAIQAISDLSKSGHEIFIISSCGLSKLTHDLRKNNLITVFGDVFSDFHLIDFHKTKLNELTKYKNSEAFWVDDVYHHYIAGKNLGFNAIWKTTEHNKVMQSQPEHKNENIQECWKDIKSLILSNSP